MKSLKNISVLMAAIIMMSLAGCKNKEGAATGAADSGLTAQIRKERIEHNKKVYDMAGKVGDSYTQLNALYSIMADDTTNNLKNMDSVAEIYVRLSMGLPAMKMAEKILEKDPGNEKMLELKAEGDMGMNKNEEALNINRKLYEKTKKLKYLFNIANVQMQMGNKNDLNQTIQKIKTSPDYQTDSIDVVDEQSGRLQKVPAPAVMSYVEAMISYSNKDVKGMAEKLKQALNIFPQYGNAQRYMRAIMQQSQRANGGQ